MKALLKTGEWVEIDTSCLFNNQYNTTEEYGNKRIFDGDIRKIVDDIRLGLGKCKYCGEIVKRGEEEKHFLEKENKSCDKCFWYRDELVSKEEPIVERKEIIEDLPDGTQRRIEYKNVIRNEVYRKKCIYNERNTYVQDPSDCTNKECRKYGIKWFTPENCYFLRYPNGTDDYTMEDWLRHSWEQNSPFMFVYTPYIGSYTLKVTLKEDQKTIDKFILSNARNHVVFTYDMETELYSIYDGIHNSPRTSKNVLPTGNNYPKCNAKINWTVKIVVTNVYESAKKVKGDAA